MLLLFSFWVMMVKCWDSQDEQSFFSMLYALIIFIRWKSGKCTTTPCLFQLSLVAHHNSQQLVVGVECAQWILVDTLVRCVLMLRGKEQEENWKNLQQNRVFMWGKFYNLICRQLHVCTWTPCEWIHGFLNGRWLVLSWSRCTSTCEWA